VHFTDEGALIVAEMLLVNQSLHTLIFANTEVEMEASKRLTNVVLTSKSIFTFRWSNLKDMGIDSENLQSASKLILIEKTQSPLTR
jgi:hypothetical protein